MNAAAVSSQKAAYPWRFRPQYKDYLWGGDRIIRHFHRNEPPGVYAESWEVSTRPEGPSVICNGPCAGTPLADALPGFPLLLKLIDARDTLSVQVHPDNASAARFGGEPKTEMWYVLAADPGACVYCGLKPGVDQPVLRAALASGRVGDLLERIPVTAGDAVFVPGGRVHAIGGGCLLFECQQNSNTTYRLYDWDRVGPDGKPRPLHIEESIRVIDWSAAAPPKLKPRRLRAPGRNGRMLVLDTTFFRMERLDLVEAWRTPSRRRAFDVYFVADGTVEIRAPGFRETAAAGTTYLVPEGVREMEMVPRPGAVVLRVTA